MSSPTDLAAPRTEAAPARSAGTGRAASRILIIMVAAVLAQLALVAAFTGVLSNPTVQSAEVGLVAQGPEAGMPLPGITYQPLASEAAARQKVTDGSLPAALVANGKSQTLYIDGASGPSLTAALEAEFGAAAQKESAQLATRDLRPLPASIRAVSGLSCSALAGSSAVTSGSCCCPAHSALASAPGAAPWFCSAARSPIPPCPPSRASCSWTR